MEVNKDGGYGYYPCINCKTLGLRFKSNPCRKCKRSQIISNKPQESIQEETQ